MYGYVYKTTCDMNNKVYVGHRKWSAQYTDDEYLVVPEEERNYFESELHIRAFPIDKEYLGSGKLLLEAIKMYGKSHFTVQVLEVCESRNELVTAESTWIKLFRSQGHDMYNLTDNGNTGFDIDESDDVHKTAYIQHLKEHGKTTAVNYFGDVSGVHNGRYGKPVSQLTRLRISKANTGRKQSVEERQMRSIAHKTKCPECKPPNCKGMIVINNGIINKKIYPSDLANYEGWNRGMIQKLKKED